MRCPNRPSASCKTWDPSLPIHKSQGNCMTTLIFDGTMQSPTSYKSQREALLSHPLGPKSDFTMSISADARWKDVTLYHTSSVLKTSLNAYWLNYPSWFFYFCYNERIVSCKYELFESPPSCWHEQRATGICSLRGKAPWAEPRMTNSVPKLMTVAKSETDDSGLSYVRIVPH